jgi:hypothetical protein
MDETYRRLSSYLSRAIRALCVATGCVLPAGVFADTITFGASAPGATPAQFDFARTGQGGPGQWRVMADEAAQGGRALEQSSTDKTDYRFPLAIYRPLSAKDVEVTIRFKPLAGEVDRAGGIAVRLTSPDNYYVVRANALEDNVRFYRVVRGRRIQLKSANAKVFANEWHTLGIKAQGDRFTISFEGKPLYSVVDKTFTQEGKVALWTKADSVTRFDTLEIVPLP